MIIPNSNGNAFNALELLNNGMWWLGCLGALNRRYIMNTSVSRVHQPRILFEPTFKPTIQIKMVYRDVYQFTTWIVRWF